VQQTIDSVSNSKSATTCEGDSRVSGVGVRQSSKERGSQRPSFRPHGFAVGARQRSLGKAESKGMRSMSSTKDSTETQQGNDREVPSPQFRPPPLPMPSTIHMIVRLRTRPTRSSKTGCPQRAVGDVVLAVAVETPPCPPKMAANGFGAAAESATCSGAIRARSAACFGNALEGRLWISLDATRSGCD